MIYYAIIICMTFMGATASYFLKKASASQGIKELVFNRFLYLGGIIYVLSAGLNVYILKFLDYSVVLPLTSITYIWTMIFSYFLLKEKITSKKIIGVGFIILGGIMVGLG